MPSGCSCSAALPRSHRGHHVKGSRPPVCCGTGAPQCRALPSSWASCSTPAAPADRRSPRGNPVGPLGSNCGLGAVLRGLCGVGLRHPHDRDSVFHDCVDHQCVSHTPFGHTSSLSVCLSPKVQPSSPALTVMPPERSLSMPGLVSYMVSVVNFTSLQQMPAPAFVTVSCALTGQRAAVAVRAISRDCAPGEHR